MDIAKHILWSVVAVMAALLFAIAFHLFGLWVPLFLVVLVGLLDGVFSGIDARRRRHSVGS